jgi:hypothetical protein
VPECDQIKLHKPSTPAVSKKAQQGRTEREEKKYEQLSKSRRRWKCRGLPQRQFRHFIAKPTNSCKKLIVIRQPSGYLKFKNDVKRNNTEVHSGIRKVAMSRNFHSLQQIIEFRLLISVPQRTT